MTGVTGDGTDGRRVIRRVVMTMTRSFSTGDRVGCEYRGPDGVRLFCYSDGAPSREIEVTIRAIGEGVVDDAGTPAW